MNPLVATILVPGAVGGLVRTLEKTADMTALKEIDVVKVARTLIFGAIGAYITAATGVSNLIVLGVSGYFGDKVILNALQTVGTIVRK